MSVVCMQITLFKISKLSFFYGQDFSLAIQTLNFCGQEFSLVNSVRNRNATCVCACLHAGRSAKRERTGPTNVTVTAILRTSNTRPAWKVGGVGDSELRD